MGDCCWGIFGERLLLRVVGDRMWLGVFGVLFGWGIVGWKTFFLTNGL